MKLLNPIPSITIIDNKETINVASLQGRKNQKERRKTIEENVKRKETNREREKERENKKE